MLPERAYDDFDSISDYFAVIGPYTIIVSNTRMNMLLSSK